MKVLCINSKDMTIGNALTYNKVYEVIKKYKFVGGYGIYVINDDGVSQGYVSSRFDFTYEKRLERDNKLVSIGI